MKALPLHEQRIRDYIERNYGYSGKISYEELAKGYGATTVFYDELDKIEVDGFPVSSDYMRPDGSPCSQQEFLELSAEEKSKCRLRYYYLPKCHELYVGGTGAGKTTGCVEPQLRALAKQKNKSNLFLTDPKGELYDRNAQHLIDNGYRLYVLNFKNFARSDRWNPLLELYDMNIKLRDLGKGVEVKKGKVPMDVELMGPEENFTDKYYLYNDIAFPSEETLDCYIECEKDIIEAQVDDLLNQYTNMFIQVKNDRDPSWEYGSQDLLRGIIHLMLEESLDENSGFTRDMISIKSIRDIYMQLKTPILSDECKLYNHPLVEGKSDKIKRLMATALANAPNTMKSYCGVFNGAISDWFQSHILSLTTGNTISLDEDDKPVAIFVITRDYDKSDFKIAGLFIDWVYRRMLEKSESGKKTRTLHFMLDEFGNVPKIKDFENKISTARSRDIWFHLVLQSYNQLDAVYTEKMAEIIKDNCNAQIFLGSQNRRTKELFSEQCGKTHVKTLSSELRADRDEITDVPLVPENALDFIKPGEMFIKRMQVPVICARYIRSYIMTDNGDFPYPDAKGLRNNAPLNLEPISSEKYTFTKKTNTNTDEQGQKRFAFDF